MQGGWLRKLSPVPCGDASRSEKLSIRASSGWFHCTARSLPLELGGAKQYRDLLWKKASCVQGFFGGGANLHHHHSILTHNSVLLERWPLCLTPRKTNHIKERSPRTLLFCAWKYTCPHFQFSLSTGVCLFDCFILRQLGTKIFLFCLFLQLFLQFNKSNTKLRGVNKARDGAVHSITLLIGNTALECRGRAPNQKFQMPEASSFPIRLKVSLDNQ